jgi:hypothetical protein
LPLSSAAKLLMLMLTQINALLAFGGSCVFQAAMWALSLTRQRDTDATTDTGRWELRARAHCCCAGLPRAMRAVTLLALLLCAGAACAAAQPDAAAAAADTADAHASASADPDAPPVTASAGATRPHPQPAPHPPLDLLALGTVLHSVTPDGAPGKALEPDALIYLRCYPTNTSSSFAASSASSSAAGGAGAFPNAAGGGDAWHRVPLAAAANADRRQGLHATLPVERVASVPTAASSSISLEAHTPSEAPSNHNAYHVGDWGALRGSDLWCELYDIDRAAAGLTDALGGTLLRAADFAAAQRDQLTCVDCAALFTVFACCARAAICACVCAFLCAAR